MNNFKPTDEQVAIVDAANTGDDLVVEAAAGSGKTSTLRLLAAANPGRGLYLAYNRAIKDDADKSFPASVRCVTAHGLAYRPVAGRYINAGRKVGGARVPAATAVRLLGINEPVRLAADLAPLAPQQLARIAIATVDRFCHSADDEPAARHVPAYPGLDDDAVRAELARAVLPYAKRAWADIQDLKGRLRFTHDHYLKLYQLSRPILDVDYLLVDEAQDLNPVVQAIVALQDHAQVILVGDRNQQLYAWRGAVDAMATFQGKRLQLTQSFRFGDTIADEANKWLAVLRSTMRVRGFDKVPSVVGPVQRPDAVLCRTNGTALGRVMDGLAAGRRVALVGGGGDIAAMARAADDLQSGRPCDHPELMAFASWYDVLDYVAQDEAGSDLKVFINLVEKHGTDTILQVVDRLVDESRADLVVSTSHKSKGREWGSVAVATDFREPVPRDGMPGIIDRADAMLAYVTVTRARLALDREGLAWVDRYVPLGAQYHRDPLTRAQACAAVAPEYVRLVEPSAGDIATVALEQFADEYADRLVVAHLATVLDDDDWPAPVPAPAEDGGQDDEQPAGPAPTVDPDPLVDLYAHLVEPASGGGWLAVRCLRCYESWQDCTCALMPDRRWTTGTVADAADAVQDRLAARWTGFGARTRALVEAAEHAQAGAR